MVYQGGMFRCDEHMICYAKPTIPGDVNNDIQLPLIQISDAQDFVTNVKAKQHRM